MHTRLGKNLGRYHGESIPIDEIQAEGHEAALKAGWMCETFFSAPGVVLRAYFRRSPASRKNVYVSTGVHGDEPSGPLAVLRMLREDRWPDVNLWLVPCVNPTGFRLNTRENDQGVDLNRDYRALRTMEVAAHVAWLRRQPIFDVSLLLHEDWEANGFYIYELNPRGQLSLAEGMIEAARERCAIEHAELVDNFECRGGIIRPKVKPEERPEWAEAIYLMANNSAQNYTLETPSDFPLALRVETHLAALQRGLELI